MSVQIPITNLYYLFCYAWDRFEEGKSLGVGSVPGPDISDLFAWVLARAIERLLKRGLDRGYVTHSEDTTRLRGRINFAETLKRDLLHKAQAHCEFDELEYDVLHNQILSTTVANLASVAELDPDNRQKLRALKRKLREISIIDLRPSTFRRVQLHRNNVYYDFLMKLCELIYGALLPTETGARFRFENVLHDEKKMWRVFQRFVHNFYKAESEYSVRAKKIDWAVTPGSDDDMHLLPEMATDVCLEGQGRTIIIDTKYTANILQKHPFSRKETFDPAHLYQIFSYVSNWALGHPANDRVEGILLYPTTSKEIDATYEIKGCKLRVATIDLSRENWSEIHDRLLKLVA